jgi:hypothetical protein
LSLPSHFYESIHDFEHSSQCSTAALPNTDQWGSHTAVAVVREMALIVDHVLPNAANDTFRASRSFDDFVASFPLCLRDLRRPVVLLLTCSDKVQQFIQSLTIPGSRYETLVLCCGPAWNKLGSRGSESDRCSCLRSGFSLEVLT